MPPPPLYYQMGYATDIGGGRENQDDGFVWTKRDEARGRELIVLCVLDGHGREVGKRAAQCAKEFLLQRLEQSHASLHEEPVAFIADLFAQTHQHIKQVFREAYEQGGWEVREEREGFLTKTRRATQQTPAAAVTCIHGGCTCTLLCLVDGDALFVANVGDSAAMLASPAAGLGADLIARELDLADHTGGQGRDEHVGAAASAAAPSYLLLTAEHSPESPAEFRRLLRHAEQQAPHAEQQAQQPLLCVVYDSSAHDKSQCSPVFASPDTPVPSGRGSYYKNVRREWASLVCTPSSARFADALAFTRSLGDFHIHSYGVTWRPCVRELRLRDVFARLQQSTTAATAIATTAAAASSRTAEGGAEAQVEVDAAGDGQGHNPASASPLLCLLVASDGVWDNWQYGDIARFLADPSCLKALAHAGGAQRVCASFLSRNGAHGKRNFGAQQDNSTAILVYLSQTPGVL